MARRSRRDMARTAVLAVASGAVIAAAVAALGPAAAAGRPHQSVPVVINCVGKEQTSPSGYILACGDAGAYLTKLHWAAWGQTDAFGNGTYNYRAGHLHTFPVLVALWAAKPLPGHAGTRYFSSMTIIFTGNRRYTVGGKNYREPQTLTFPLSALGGA